MAIKVLLPIDAVRKWSKGGRGRWLLAIYPNFMSNIQGPKVEYLKRAALAREEARKASTEQIRQDFLRLAREWEWLAGERERSAIDPLKR